MTAEPSTYLKERPTLLGVLRAQRRIIAAALILSLAAFWILGPLDEWLTAVCAVIGIALGLGNHVLTEYWLGRLLSGGGTPTRRQIGTSTFVRLGILSIVAVAIAVPLWPSGVALLLGLAIFRLIALVMTGIPLLKELKNA